MMAIGLQKVNANFHVSQDAVFTLLAPKYLRITSGTAEAWDGGTAEAWGAGSRAVARDGGTAIVVNDLPGLATDGQHTLRRDEDGMYYAGFRGPWTAEQALTHWDREDDRACLYTLAIGLAEST